MTTLTPQATLGHLVVERASRAQVFEHFGLDYCCHGTRTLADACRHHGVAPEDVISALEAVDAYRDLPGEPDWAATPPGALIRHIVDVHHAYLHVALPRLTSLMSRVVQAHADRHPELAEAARGLARFCQAVEGQMAKEEGFIFPLIAIIASDDGRGNAAQLRGPLGTMEAEHLAAHRDLQALRQLTDGWTAPADACATYVALLEGLRDLEVETHRHVHLENNVLFPLALALAAPLPA